MQVRAEVLGDVHDGLQRADEAVLEPAEPFLVVTERRTVLVRTRRQVGHLDAEALEQGGNSLGINHRGPPPARPW